VTDNSKQLSTHQHSDMCRVLLELFKSIHFPTTITINNNNNNKW